MNEIDKTNSTDQKKVRLNKITEIENYFHQEINQRRLCGKKLSIYVAAFGYIDKVLMVLSATCGGGCIVYSASVAAAPFGKAGASFALIFSLTTRIIKKLLSITRNKKKKHDRIIMLAKSKLNTVETFVSQALTDVEISNEEFIRITKEKDEYEKMKESLRSVSEKQENMRLNSVNSKNCVNKLCEK